MLEVSVFACRHQREHADSSQQDRYQQFWRHFCVAFSGTFGICIWSWNPILKSAINVQNTWESTKKLSPVSLYEHELMYSLDYVLACPDRKRNSSSNSKWKIPITWVILSYGRKLFCRECTSGRTVQLLFHSCKRLLKKNIAVPNHWQDMNQHINISQSHACTPRRITLGCLANYNFLLL